MCKDSIFFWMSNIFVTYSPAPARCEPNRLLSFAQPSLILRLSFAYPSSHTRLRQLADFPSVKLRRREGEVILNFEFWILNWWDYWEWSKKRSCPKSFVLWGRFVNCPYNMNENDWLSERLTLSNFESLLKCVALGVRQKNFVKLWKFDKVCGAFVYFIFFHKFALK